MKYLLTFKFRFHKILVSLMNNECMDILYHWIGKRVEWFNLWFWTGSLLTKALALMGVFLSAIYLKGHQLLSPWKFLNRMFSFFKFFQIVQDDIYHLISSTTDRTLSSAPWQMLKVAPGNLCWVRGTWLSGRGENAGKFVGSE